MQQVRWLLGWNVCQFSFLTEQNTSNSFNAQAHPRWDTCISTSLFMIIFPKFPHLLSCNVSCSLSCIHTTIHIRAMNNNKRGIPSFDTISFQGRGKISITRVTIWVSYVITHYNKSNLIWYHISFIFIVHFRIHHFSFISFLLSNIKSINEIFL